MVNVYVWHFESGNQGSYKVRNIPMLFLVIKRKTKSTIVRHVDKMNTYHAYSYNITVLNRFKEFMTSIQFLSI